MNLTVARAALLCVAALTSAAADAAASDDAAFTIGEIVVTASRLPNGNRSLYSSVDILGADKIERLSVDNSWELFGRLPGVQLTDFGQGTTSGKLSFRAFNGEGEVNAVKLLIDGIPSNANDGNMPFIDLVTPLEIERIETVRGTVDPRWGLHAVAGTASIVTRSGDEGLRLRAVAGSFGTYEAQAAAGIVTGRLTQDHSAAWRHSDGWRQHSELDRFSVAGKWLLEASDRLRLGASVRYGGVDAEEPGYLTQADASATPRRSYHASATDGGRRRLGQVSVHADLEATDDVDLGARAYLNRLDDRRFVRFSASVAQQERYADETQKGLVASLRWRPEPGVLHRLTIEAGGDVQWQDNLSQRWLTADRARARQTRDQQFHFTIGGAWAQATIEPTSWLKLVPAFRVDAAGGTLADRLTGRSFGANDHGLIKQPKISIAVTPADDWTLFGNWGRSFQVGVGAGAYLMPPRTADLAPSINDGWEVGAKFSPGRRFEARVAAWQQVASGEVKRRLNDPLGDFDNLGRTRRRGVDVQLAWRPSDALELWGTYGWQRATIVVPDPAAPDTAGKWIDHVPPFIATAGIDWQVTDRLQLSLWGAAQGDYFLERTNSTGKFGGYAVANLAVHYRVSDAVSVDVQLKNLTNDRYSYAWWDGAQRLFAPAEPRSVFAALSVGF